MSVRFQCAHCLSHLTVSRRFAGKRGRCPNCRTRILVPEISVDTPNIQGLAKDVADSPTVVQDTKPGSTLDISQLDESTRAPARRRRRKKSRVSSSDTNSLLTEKVPLPRWAIYAQGGLLGIVATTFFIFGLAVGTENPIGGPQAETGPCQVQGSVFYDEDNQRSPDLGAVVMLLPEGAAPRQRPTGKDLNPTTFRAIENRGIDMIRSLGGSVVRVDAQGNFATDIDANRNYWLLIISKHQSADNDTIGKQTRADLGAWFLPIENLLQDRAFVWSKFKPQGPTHQIPTTNF